MTPLEQDLVDLLQIESPTGQEQRLVLHLYRRLQAAKHLSLNQQGLTLVYSTEQDSSKPTLALLGHTDTIAAPYAAPQVLDDKIVGLGASDMKGGLAVMLRILEEYNGLGPALEQFRFLRNLNLALVLEPTDNQLQVGCLGALHAKVTVPGKAAHSARPWQGENALHRAWPLLQKLDQLQPVRHQISGLEFFEVLSATQAATNNSRNVVPPGLQLNLNYRFAPGKPLEQACSELRDFVGPGIELEFVDQCPSGKVVQNNPILDELANRFSLKREGKQAWTDIARLGDYGLDAANFGPGQPAQAHQQGEWISRAALAAHYQMLQQFLYFP